ncbi:MAG: hypothetical protein AB7I79_20225 [Rhizobiaceae bacterium]
MATLAGSTGTLAEELETTTIGDLTFNYKSTSWRIEHEGSGLATTCVHDDCRGAVIDISRREGEAGCTEEAMVAEAERLFPVQGRAYANMLPAGRFALMLAQRHDGPDLSSPEFAHGCVAWQGREYRFAMRPETVGTQSWIGGALHYLVANATAPEAVIKTLRIGDVDFPVSTETWTIGHVGDTVWLTCRMPTCHEPDIAATLSVQSPQEPCPAPTGDGEDENYTRVETLVSEAPEGLDFTISETSLGCRNYVPPSLEACAIHGGRSYHLSVPGASGCRSAIWDIPKDVLVDLLKGARITR